MASTHGNLTGGAVTLLQAFENVTGEVLLPEADFNWHWEESALSQSIFWGKKKEKNKRKKKERKKRLAMLASRKTFYREGRITVIRKC